MPWNLFSLNDLVSAPLETKARYRLIYGTYKYDYKQFAVEALAHSKLFLFIMNTET